MNFARGITEATKQTYKHLSKLLKPLPLETPTRIELAPGNVITITLFDANHCVGSVMFLVESETASVLYTGDVRAEDWWVNWLARHPFLLPYIPPPNGAGTKRLDNVYLDTTFARKSAPFRTFVSKAEGLAELLQKLSEYPSHTQFYFHAWTFGYEDVLLTLSHTLNSRIHLDSYRLRVYNSLAKTLVLGGGNQPAASFCGFLVGNVDQPGILTGDHRVRLHSCESGTNCWATDLESCEQIVHIKPIVTRDGNEDVEEVGLGGGQGDLDQVHELELSDAGSLNKLLSICDQTNLSNEIKQQMKKVLEDRFNRQGEQHGGIRLGTETKHRERGSNNLKLEELVDILQRQVGF